MNNFIFNGTNYVQKQRCPIGTNAHHIMQIFSRENLKETSYIYLLIFQIFIVNLLIFFLWNGNKTQLVDIIASLNSRQPTIKLDFKYSKSGIKFLGTKIYKNNVNNKLLTKINWKPRGRRNFLDPTLAHPKSLINRIPCSQAL